MNDKQQEEQLNKWVKKAYYDVDIPDGTESWKKTKKEINRIGRRKRWVRRIKLGALIACCSLILGFAINTDLPTAYSHVQTLIKKVQDNFVNIFFDEPEPHIDDHPGAITPPPPDSTNGIGGESNAEDVSLEEAKEKAMFAVVAPSLIPEGYSLDIIRAFQDSGGDYRTILMEYVNQDDLIIQLSQRLLGEGASAEMTTIQNEEAEIKDVTIAGNAAVLISTNNGILQLEWLTPDQIKFSLFGKLSEEELIRMAESLN